MTLSRIEKVAAMEPEARREWADALTSGQVAWLRTAPWEWLARPEQLPAPGPWFEHLIQAGRGWGKTRSGAEWMHDRARSGAMQWGGVVGPTKGATRDVLVEGPSGLLATAHASCPLEWEPSKRRLTWANGAQATTYTAEEPEDLRGPEHDTIWADEPGVYRHGERLRYNIMFGLRVRDPKILWTTTPRNVPLIRLLVDRAKIEEAAGIPRNERRVLRTLGRTVDNLHNLAPVFDEEVVHRYAGTRIGRQELDAELLDEIGEVFWRAWFVDHVVDELPDRAGLTVVRFWDLAATEASEATPDPDWTVGARVSFDSRTRRFTIEDIVRERMTGGRVEELVQRTANADGPRVRIGMEQEPGASGKSEVERYKRKLTGYVFGGYPASGDKALRAQAVAVPAEQGRVDVLQAEWLDDLLDEIEQFTEDDSHLHDDQVDALSGAFTLAERHSSRPAKVTTAAGRRVPTRTAAGKGSTTGRNR